MPQLVRIPNHVQPDRPHHQRHDRPASRVVGAATAGGPDQSPQTNDRADQRHHRGQGGSDSLGVML
jgi:hypothetical protein